LSAERRAVAKATRRLIPFLFGIYIVAYLDRVNVSFAQLQLEDDLDFSSTIFGLGAGIFSLGYVIFGLPSNILLERFGARRWLSAIMVAWGLLSASMLFIEGATSFYVLRFLLGVAEAGFFPGIVLYLTWWFPEADRGRTLALFMTAISASYVIGGPLSGGLLELDGVAGLEGWQRWREIIGLAHLAVAKRPGSALSPSGPIHDVLDRHGVTDPSDLHRREAGCLLIRDVPALDISASAIRARIAAGRSPRHLLPDAVLDVIRRNSLYR